MTPVLLPLLQDSASYGNGQNAGRQIGREWTVTATKVDKVPVGFADAMMAGAEAATVNSPSLFCCTGWSGEGVHAAVQGAHVHHSGGHSVRRYAVEVAFQELPYLFARCRPQSPQ